MLSISVIIPTLNEQSCLRETLVALERDPPAEILVVDGGSDDCTVQIARQHAQVLSSIRGRAVQQNLGAKRSSGRALLFLHADSRLEPGWQREVERVLVETRCPVGCFRLRIDATRPVYRWIERGVELRTRWFGMPYGDQGIFLMRGTFQRLGGFPEIRLMEDLMFMSKARRMGRVGLARSAVRVSPRRWEQSGAVRQTLRNWALASLALWAGVHPNDLAKFYPSIR